MYRTILGEAGFKKGMKLYFERHDGGAVTCDDFRAAMAGTYCTVLHFTVNPTHFVAPLLRGHPHSLPPHT
jgi:hypothetical protein